MKDKINRFAEGDFKFIQSEIKVSEEALYLSAPAGSTSKGTFFLTNQDGTDIKAVLYSSNPHVILENNKVYGTDNRIDYIFDAVNLEPDDKFSGEINIVSDCGEMILPFSVSVEAPFCEASIGKIKDLFHLANLAKENYVEAVKVFESKKFDEVLSYYNKKHLVLYRHLLKSADPSFALEEFLIAVHKKLRIRYKTDKNEIAMSVGTDGAKDTLIIEKDTWGYGKIRIRCDAPYIVFDKYSLTTDDFVGNSFEAQFEVIPSKMPCGRNYSKILIEAPHQTIEIPVYIERNAAGSLESINRRKLKQYTAKLLENYLGYMSGTVVPNRYVSEAESLISIIKNLDNNIVFEIYRIYTYIQTGREASVKNDFALLSSKLSKTAGISAAASYAYDYMSALMSKDQHFIKDTYNTLRDEYERNSDEWLLLIMMSGIDRRHSFGPSMRFNAFKKQFSMGCISPVLYVEAIRYLNADPSVLKAADAFEAQILCFGARNNAISKDAALAAAYASGRAVTFSKPLYRALVLLYEKYKAKELISAICMLLVRGKKKDPVYHKWYELGVAEQLKITGLYEFFMESVGEVHGKPLPQQIITYFSYNSKLSEKQEAFLYADIILNKDRNPAGFHAFDRQILEFAERMLNEHRISRDLAVIYREASTNFAEHDLSGKLVDLAFKYEFKCLNSRITSVIVAHKELSEEREYPLDNGTAFIDIFTENAEIFPADADGNRYYATVEFSLNKINVADEGFEENAACANPGRMLTLHRYEEAQFRHMDSEVANIYKAVCDLADLEEEFRSECELKLVKYFFEADEGALLESYLLKINFDYASKADRAKVIEYMISRELYNSALVAINKYGYDEVDEKRLLKLAQRLILMLEGEPTQLLLGMAHSVFKKGKYNETLLAFLSEFYNGSTSDMHDIWESAKGFDIDTSGIEERLVSQTLFTETYVEDNTSLFRNYYSKGVNRKLIRACLSYYAYRYLVNDRIIDREILDIMRRELNYDENDICLLAVLKSLSGEKKYTGQEINFINRGISQLEAKNMLLPFIKSFENSDIRVPKQMLDKHYIEYHADAKDEVRINYIIETGHDSDTYVSEPMRNVCFGIYIKEFVIFCNEFLQYYITCNHGGEDVVEESSELRIEPSLLGSDETKYQQLNLIITAKEMNDEQTVLRLLENYTRNEYRIEALFRPIF